MSIRKYASEDWVQEKLNELGGGAGGNIGSVSWNDLTDRPFYSEGGIVEILPLTEATRIEDTGNFTIADKVQGIEKGKTYVINYNSVDYECVATSVQPTGMEGMSIIVLGNYGLMLDGNSTSDEPFVIGVVPKELAEESDIGLSIYDLTGASSVAISINMSNEIIHKIDKKYLPDDICKMVSWNDLEDRPFGDITETLFTWDGDTSKITDKVECDGNNVYRVADYIPVENFYGATIYANVSGQDMFAPLMQEFFEKISDSITVVADGMLIFSNCDDAYMPVWDVTLEKSGIYCMDPSTTGLLVTSVLKTTTKQINSKFLPKTSWNDLEDKPFGDTTKIMFEWDGDISSITETGKLSIDGNTFDLYRIADYSPIEEYYGAKVVASEEGEFSTFELDADEVMYITNNIALLIGNVILVVSSDDNQIFNGFFIGTPLNINLGKAGIYHVDTAITDGYFLSSIKHEGEIKTIDKQFLPKFSWNDLIDKPFGDDRKILLEWNGDITGIEPVIGSDYDYYRICDAIPEEEVIGATLYFTDGTEIKINSVEDFNYYVENSTWRIFPANNNAQLMNIQVAETYGTFTTAGLYSTSPVDYPYVFKISKGSLVKLDEKFLPEHTHSWNDLTDIPDKLPEHTHSWNDLTDVPDNFGTGSGDSSQSDWNVNDETDPSYIKNRAYYTASSRTNYLLKDCKFVQSDLSDLVSGYFQGYKCLIKENNSELHKLEKGKEYHVVVNGVEDVLTAYERRDTHWNIGHCLGEPNKVPYGFFFNVDSPEDEDYLICFCISKDYDETEDKYNLITDNGYNVSIDIYEVISEDIEMPQKYIPNADWDEIVEGANGFVKNKPFYRYNPIIIEEQNPHLYSESNSCKRYMLANIGENLKYGYSDGCKKIWFMRVPNIEFEAIVNDKVQTTKTHIKYQSNLTDIHKVYVGNYAILAEYDSLSLDEAQFPDGIDTGEDFYFYTDVQEPSSLLLFTREPLTYFKLVGKYYNYERLEEDYIDLPIKNGSDNNMVFEGGQNIECHTSVVLNSIKDTELDAIYGEYYGNKASGLFSVAEGMGTIASGMAQHVQGAYNIEDTENKYAHIVGNSDEPNKRSNAYTLDWEGNAWFAGNVYVGGTGQNDETVKKLMVEPTADDALALLIEIGYIEPIADEDGIITDDNNVIYTF